MHYQILVVIQILLPHLHFLVGMLDTRDIDLTPDFFAGFLIAIFLLLEVVA